MVSSVLSRIQQAWSLAQQRAQLGFILVLMIVFPLAFTYMLQEFLSVADTQANVASKNNVAILQDSLVIMVQNESSQELLTATIREYVTSIAELTDAHIAIMNGDDLEIFVASNEAQIGRTIENSRWHLGAVGQPTGLIYPFERAGERVWRAYRAINVAGQQFFIYTENNFSAVDRQLQQRVMNGYLMLIAMVLFLAMLVWWLWRQPDIAAKLKASETRLTEQFNFTNMMVHELRAPLTVIRGYASMVEESSQLPPTQHEQVQKISTSVDRLGRLVNDFLEVARLQAGTIKVESKPQDIRATITQIVDEHTAQAEAKSLAISATVPTQPVTIPIDIARLQQIVTNLVSNAIKYTDTGSITVVLTEKADEVEVRIKDTGHGISAEDQAKLFQPFMRVGNADAGQEIGSGLGMWITKKLVTLLGGTITLESIAEVGTHAIVHLPKGRQK